MSIEDIVRTSMEDVASDLAPTVPDPAAVRGRVNRVRRVKAVVAVGLVAAAAAAVVGAGTLRDRPTEQRPTGPVSPSTSATGQPVRLDLLRTGQPLTPGRYAVPVIPTNGPMRADVDVPSGYFNTEGWVIDDGNDDLAPHQFGDVGFWGGVDAVSTDPCRGGHEVKVGPSVHDLAVALAAQRHRTTTQPVPVTLGGYDGLYLTSTGATSVDRCDGGVQTLFHATGSWSTRLQDETPKKVDHLWILDVRGQRIVVVARVAPGHTTHPAQLLGIAQSARFTFDDRS
jgi:hypothetical protein